MAEKQPKTASEVQGEGDYKAARDAEPKGAREEQQLEQAERAGRQRAKDEDPLLDRPEDIETSKTGRK